MPSGDSRVVAELCRDFHRQDCGSFNGEWRLSLAEDRNTRVISGGIDRMHGESCTKSGHLPVHAMHVIESKRDKTLQF